MKKIILFIICGVFFLSNFSFGQKDCANYNAFLNNENTLTTLEEYTKVIYPSGLIAINPASELGNIEELFHLFELDEETSFHEVSQQRNFNNEDVYLRYQQSYKGIKIEGGGYVHAISDDPPGPDDDDPCDIHSLSLTPSFFSAIDLDVTPSVKDKDILDIVRGGEEEGKIDEESLDTELVISPNLQSCSFELVWIVNYIKNSVTKTARIDATNGNIRGISTDNSSKSTDSSILRGGGEIILYDVSGLDCNDSADELEAGLIPPMNPLNAEALSFLNTVEDVVSIFESLGIELPTLHIGIGCGEQNIIFQPYSLGGNELMNGYITFGTALNFDFLQCETVAHELAHFFLLEFFPYSSLQNRAVHEGIADMFAAYVEHYCDTGVGADPWIAGDQVTNLISGRRDLRDPAVDCFDEILVSGNNLSPHGMGSLISHAFFLLSEGDQNLGINGIGIQNAMDVLMNIIPTLPENVTIFGFADALMAGIGGEYGFCSEDMSNVINLLEELCFSPDYPCPITVHGNLNVCKDDNLNLFVDDNTGLSYRWDFPFGWTVLNNASGSSTQGSSLTVLEFPDYDYYPQYFEVCVRAMRASEVGKTCVTIKVGCSGDGPSCQEYYGNHGLSMDNELMSPASISKYSTKSPTHFRIYNILGIELYQGNIQPIKELNLELENQVFMVSYFDEFGDFIETKKSYLIN